MADQILEILIKFGLREEAAKQAVKEIDALKSATQESTKAGVEGAKEHTKHIGGLHRAVHILGHQFGEVGRIGSMAFYSLGAAAITGLAVGIGIVKRSWEAFGEYAKEQTEIVKDGIGDMAEALRGVQTETIKADRAFADMQKSLERNTKNAIKNIDTIKEGFEAVLNAAEKFELSQIGRDADPETKERLQKEIRLKYGDARRDVKEQAESRVINAQQYEYDVKRLALMAKEQEMAGKSEEKTKVRLDYTKSAIADLKSQLAAQTKLDEKSGGFWPTLGALFKGAFPGGAGWAEMEAQQASLGIAPKMAALQKQMEGRLPGLQHDLVGFQEIQTLRTSLDALTDELRQSRNSAATSKLTGRFESSLESGMIALEKLPDIMENVMRRINQINLRMNNVNNHPQ